MKFSCVWLVVIILFLMAGSLAVVALGRSTAIAAPNLRVTGCLKLAGWQGEYVLWGSELLRSPDDWGAHRFAEQQRLALLNLRGTEVSTAELERLATQYHDSEVAKARVDFTPLDAHLWIHRMGGRFILLALDYIPDTDGETHCCGAFEVSGADLARVLPLDVGASTDVSAKLAPPDVRPTPTPYAASRWTEDWSLNIPALDVEALAIVEVPFDDRRWDESVLGSDAGWLQGTTFLEPDWGNTVIVGHSSLAARPGPFAGLAGLDVGDSLILERQGERIEFVVTDVYEVKATDMAVTMQDKGPRLTLLTCSGDGRRVVVSAERQ